MINQGIISMDKFEQHIKNTMNQPPEFPFKEGLWDALETRMSEESPPVNTPPDNQRAWMTWLPALLLFLIPSVLAGILYQKHTNTLTRLATLEQKLEQQISTPKTNYIDSTLQKHVTIIYDTVHYKVVVNQNINQQLNAQVEAALLSYQQALMNAQQDNIAAYQPELFTNFNSNRSLKSLAPPSSPFGNRSIVLNEGINGILDENDNANLVSERLLNFEYLIQIVIH